MARHRLAQALRGYVARTAPAPIQTATVAAVTGAGYYVTVDAKGHRKLSAPSTDEPHRAGDLVLIEQTDSGRPAVHGKAR